MIAKFLPFAIVGLSILSMTNTVGKMSGLPIPDISPILGNTNTNTNTL
jgi:hypothetical protein